MIEFSLMPYRSNFDKETVNSELNQNSATINLFWDSLRISTARYYVMTLLDRWLYA